MTCTRNNVDQMNRTTGVKAPLDFKCGILESHNRLFYKGCQLHHVDFKLDFGF